ncbi:MAG: hypothetical protein NXI16_05595 [Alphaproteobacteria bacterium]|nr:hypothetical protein [Alphaproteobacteria bacterium]
MNTQSRMSERRTHNRVSKPNIFVRINGYVYQPEDASLGGFSICPYDGPLWNGDGFEGELMEPDGTSHPFSGEVVTHLELQSKLACRFVALSDPGFDALTRGISSQYTARNALDELEHNGRASEHFMERLKRLPNEVLAQFDRQQLDALRRVFDAPERNRHFIDQRRSMTVFGRTFYFVLLMGRDRRKAGRGLAPEKPRFGFFSRLAEGLVKIVFVGVVIALIALPLYAVKTMAGVDILDNTGLSTLWRLLKEQVFYVL